MSLDNNRGILKNQPKNTNDTFRMNKKALTKNKDRGKEAKTKIIEDETSI